jgi:hypothetical protein
MRLAALYAVYIFAGICMMLWFRMTPVPRFTGITMSTIWLYTLCWASNYTYVKWLGKMFRRQKKKDAM